MSGSKKIFGGARIRTLRNGLSLTQADLAKQLGISTSYLNQIENNQRPLSAAVILSLVDQFDFNLSELLSDESDKVAIALLDLLNDPVFSNVDVQKSEIKTAATNVPNFSQALVQLYDVFQNLRMQLGRLDSTMPDAEDAIAIMPYEEVREYFQRKDNYIDELDRAAEAFARQFDYADTRRNDAVAAYLKDRHGVTVLTTGNSDAAMLRRFDTKTKTLYLGRSSPQSTNLFQMAYQVGLLEQGGLMEKLLDQANFRSANAREVCRMTFANYFAGAVLLPYVVFADAARETRHDLDRLALKFGASREQIAHRLSMLQRPGKRGVPFFFVRVDRAGTVTKRHSATAFQFTRFGASCPRWNVHQAFGSEQEILRQLAVTADGVGYLCLAFSKADRRVSFSEKPRYYSIGLGCEVSYADQVVYSDDLDTSDLKRYEPIGASCRLCEWHECSHRSVPPMTHQIRIDHNNRQAVPYEIY